MDVAIVKRVEEGLKEAEKYFGKPMTEGFKECLMAYENFRAECEERFGKDSSWRIKVCQQDEGIHFYCVPA